MNAEHGVPPAIDAEIRPLVEAVNAHGFPTSESCAGHPSLRSGEPADRPEYAAPYLLLKTDDWVGVLEWVEDAEAVRRTRPGATFTDDVLITVTYRGDDTFRVDCRYVSPEESRRCIEALTEAL
jgi:hypothetical protein